MNNNEFSVVASDQIDAPQALVELTLIRTAFDLEFYLSCNEDVAKAEGVEPIEHYCAYGWREGRDPSPTFSTKFYLDENPDVRAAGLNPFFHYLAYGVADGRLPAPPDGESELENTFIEAIREAFDEGYYLANYSDIASNEDVDPLEHYVSFGWKEGRDPSPAFSTNYYLENNPDVKNAGVNPFWHYLAQGESEGRRPIHPGGYRAAILATTLPLEEIASIGRPAKAPDHILTDVELQKLISGATQTDTRGVLISIGHDDYRKISGGVQNCIQREERAAARRGMSYLNISPYAHLPRLSHTNEDSDVAVAVRLDGKRLGVAHMSAVTKAIGNISATISNIEVVVHHLMGHNVDQIEQLVRASGRTRCWLWVHDFFTLCPSYALQRNNVSFCGAPKQTSNSCSLCLYGNERHAHRARIESFFGALSVDVIAPSQFAADFWKARCEVDYGSLNVCGHMTVNKKKRTKKVTPLKKPIKVAFAGYPAPHKGWEVFEEIVRQGVDSDTQIEFVYFGVSNVSLSGVEIVPVWVTAEDPQAMVTAMADRGVDFLLHWASCAETFSLSSHEAFAAGVYVLTNSRSGNIASVVSKTGLGAVIETQADLKEMLRDGRIVSLANKARKERANFKKSLVFSELTFSVMDLEPAK